MTTSAWIHFMGDGWALLFRPYIMGRRNTRRFARRIDAIAFAARKGIRLVTR